MQSAHLRPGSTIVVMDDRVVQDRIFTEMPRRIILRRSDTGTCMNSPPDARRWLLRAHRRRAGAHILWRRMKMQADEWPQPRMCASDGTYRLWMGRAG